MDIHSTLIEMIKKSEDILVLTGTGMSTESGIPDFRSRKGVYAVESERCQRIHWKSLNAFDTQV